MNAALLLLTVLTVEEIPLRPGTTPAATPAEKVEDRGKDGVRDRAITDVSQPSVSVYLAPPRKANGRAVIICPGGGYERVVVDKEGHEVARWLNTIGVAGIVLKYRLPGKGSTAGAKSLKEVLDAKRVAVEDALDAMKLVRANAAKWKLQPDAIGMMGFSAGGHLTGLVGMSAPPELRPSFLVMVYAGVPPVLEVSASTPPTFLAHAADDKSVPVVETSLRFFTELRKHGVPAELHVYEGGGHGFGLRRKEGTVASWTTPLSTWLLERGVRSAARAAPAAEARAAPPPR